MTTPDLEQIVLRDLGAATDPDIWYARLGIHSVDACAQHKRTVLDLGFETIDAPRRITCGWRLPIDGRDRHGQPFGRNVVALLRAVGIEQDVLADIIAGTQRLTVEQLVDRIKGSIVLAECGFYKYQDIRRVAVRRLLPREPYAGRTIPNEAELAALLTYSFT